MRRSLDVRAGTVALRRCGGVRCETVECGVWQVLDKRQTLALLEPLTLKSRYYDFDEFHRSHRPLAPCTTSSYTLDHGFALMCAARMHTLE